MPLWPPALLTLGLALRGEVAGLEAEEGKEGMGLGCVAWPDDREHVGRVSREEVVRNSDCPMATLASRSWSPELACS